MGFGRHTPWQDIKRDWYGEKEQSVSPSLSLPLLELEPPTILVRDCYVTTFDRIWAKAFQSEGKNGTILSGQPGTGKTLFLYYLLVRLLQQKQKVLFSPDGEVLYLFNDDHVYESSTSEIKTSRHLPKSKSTSKIFLWSLFDIEEAMEPKGFLTRRPCLPVQATSPDPSQYKTWREERYPLLTALPLWTDKELLAGLPFQDEYPALMEALQANTLEELDLQLSRFSGVFEVLQEYQEDEKLLPPAQALTLLLENAIHHFGHSARDVYMGLFDYRRSLNLHKGAFHITYEKLREAVAALAHGETPYSISDLILSVSPAFSGALDDVSWKVDFKSDWVAKCVDEQLGAVEDTTTYQQVDLLQGIPGAACIVGRFLS
ncbi:uncharacterized protein LACBIDRAFT_318388 [Laccaria bicolor S238N-H82]|uniref:Predicted protein n=1 Tax=Laccaria bicolor (strain S238N-H82 / ATCC MYA-4686) TaxID=486041 RepID=B0D6M4_LACBS|nr:uncharacterized protein LACBIDRAFT_318388 [Laccaria bicolor S238N-H82]EDR10212.1 predicted protein [Laccaria bicolor S238N-H82]|eukprot:XP_001879597.1 predicted protein [Laccaria bicolor S238N-H82]